jgi:hypothetical protein
MVAHPVRSADVSRETVTGNGPERGHCPYSDDDLALIETLLAEGWKLEAIAQDLKRSYGALRVKLHRMGKTGAYLRAPGARPPGPRVLPDRRRRADREIEIETETKTENAA